MLETKEFHDQILVSVLLDTLKMITLNNDRHFQFLMILSNPFLVCQRYRKR